MVWYIIAILAAVAMLIVGWPVAKSSWARATKAEQGDNSMRDSEEQEDVKV